MPLPTGTLLINRYRILSILGQGGMGAVYRAVDEHLNIHVAVKENLFLTEEYSRQFQREARILASLRHPGLPHVADYFILEGQGQYLVMDFIEGEDLRQRMERTGPLPERETILVGISVCDALNFLHNSDPPIIHRDLKPGNIKVTPEGQAVLVDFGLAKVMQSGQQTMTGARAMTPGYSPPEQYGTSHTDARSDVYSLGATLYAALTGTIPEDGLNRMTGKADLVEVRALCPKVNRRFAEVIEKAMEVDPDDRFQTAEDFRLALIECGEMAAFFRERPTITPPPMDAVLAPNGEPVAAEEKISTGGRRLGSKPSGSRRRQRRSSPWVLAPLLVILIAAGYMALQLRPDLPRVVMGYFSGTPVATNGPSLPIDSPSPSPSTPVAGIGETETLESTLDATDAVTPPPKFTATDAATFTPSPTATPLGGGLSQIAFASERTGVMQIWLINADGKNLHQVTNMPNGACQPRWSPDGLRIAFVSPCPGKLEVYEGSSIYLIHVDGSGLTPLPANPEGDYDPAWSPDGRMLAFTSLRTGKPSIFTIDLDTQTVREISQSRFNDSQAFWSPTSRQIAFVRRIVYGQIWIMNDDGSQQAQLSPGGEANDFSPTWSQQGDVIFYSQILKGSKVPGLVGVRYEDRKNPREFRIPASPGIDIGPAAGINVSPDGYWFVYESWPDGTNHDIYLMSINGINIKRLTTDSGLEFGPVWRPVLIPSS